MGKKNLIILLFIPFLIAILGVVTINTTFSFIDNDIIGIEWDYKNNHTFKVSNGLYPLNATGINQKDYPAGAGNNLVWSVRNKDPNDHNVYAEIVEQGGQFFLKAIAKGEVIITCSNAKGNVFRSMNAYLYTNGIVNINKEQRLTFKNSIENVDYHGEYDLVNGEKKRSTFKIQVDAHSDSGATDVEVVYQTDNINVNLETNTVEIKTSGPAEFRIGIKSDKSVEPTSYKFEIVQDGVNVYNYQDLLYCTNNLDTDGDIVVLQTSFESLQNMYSIDESGKATQILKDVELFGTYDFKNKTYNFDNEIYKTDTTYNSRFIDQWNEQIASSDPSQELSKEIKVGIRVRKNFYGNGYTINLHNLTFPTQKSAEMDDQGNDAGKYELGLNDIFRGPKPFYSLGNPDNTPMITAHGQDNIGMYLDGDNIVLNDVKIKNCDFGKLMTNLEYVGTVVETNGDNITIKNSELSNGKHVVRSFSSMNFSIENTMLSNARNFLILVGSNDYISTEDMKGTYEFVSYEGNSTQSTIKGQFDTSLSKSDMDLITYLLGAYPDKQVMRKSLMSIQNAFNDRTLVEDKLGGSMNIKDCLFYQSGIASIGIDTMFNGSFLYNGTPSLIGIFMEFLGNIQSIKGDSLAGMSYPVEINIKGSTKFYDYKTIEQMDITGLITENLSTIAGNLPIETDVLDDLSIDKIFPMKSYLYSNAAKQNASISKDGKTYINVPVAFYGGGLNLSTVNIDTLDTKAKMTGNFEVDLLDSYLNQPGTSYEELMKILEDFLSGNQANFGKMMPVFKGLVLKCVTVVIGYEPFEFMCYKDDDLYGLVPQGTDLMLSTKGDKENENN